MTTPPAAVTAALGREKPAVGPPEDAASSATAPALLPARSPVSPASYPDAPAGGPPAVPLKPTGAKVPPVRLVPAVSQQPPMVAASVEPRVAKGGPATLVQQRPKPSNGSSRLPTPQVPQAMTIQLPANFQIPQGTVLVRSNAGQLMLVSQQALVEAQNQTPNSASIRWSIPANAPTVKIQTVQNSGTQVLKVLSAPIKTVSWTTPPCTPTIRKPAVIQSLASSSSSVPIVTTTKALMTRSLAKPLVSDASALNSASGPVSDTESTSVDLASTSAEMLENVKKCKNFLATLIKLASSGPQPPEMGQNVKNLVQSLLEAKIEPEEFTKKLYTELKSSPQPYLVPFLKKSMLALRQLMPNVQTFIQQCLQQSVPQTTSPISSSAVSASPLADTSTPVTAASLQPTSVVLKTSVVLPPLQNSGPVPCTSVVTRQPGSLQPSQPAHTVSAETDAAKVIHQTSIAKIPTCTTSLPMVKSAVSSDAVGVPHSVNSACSAAETFSQAVKAASTRAAASSTTAVTTTLQSVLSVGGTPITIRVAHPTSVLSQAVRTSQAVKIVQPPSGSILKKVTTLPQAAGIPVVTRSGERMLSNALIQTNQLPTGSIVKQITLPGNKILSLQASPVQRNKIRENGSTSFREEDDINDVTSMAGVNLNEENACILAANSEAVGTVIQSCSEELLLCSDVLQKKILETGKRHDIMEVNSDVLNLISHATQERLRGLLEKLTVIAQHRMMTYKGNDKYAVTTDTRAQLKFLEQLDHAEKQRKDEEEREILLRAAKSRSNKEDPEQLRLKQKAKEIQQLELQRMQQIEANRAALAAIGPRKKRPLDSSTLASGPEGLLGSPSLAKPYDRPRITRICLRDLIFCMEQEKKLKRSLVLYQALLK